MPDSKRTREAKRMMNRCAVFHAIIAGVILAGLPAARSETLRIPPSFVTSIAAVSHVTIGAAVHGNKKAMHRPSVSPKAQKRVQRTQQAARRRHKPAPPAAKERTVANHNYYWV